MRARALSVGLALLLGVPAAGADDEVAWPLTWAAQAPRPWRPFFMLAETAPAKPDNGPFRLGRIEIGAQGVNLDPNSSVFREYREVPEGFVVPYGRALGRGSVPYDVRVKNAGYDDALYQALVEPGPFNVAASYQRIPHRFTNDAPSILAPTGEGALTAPAGVQAQNQASLQRQFAANPAGIDATLLTALGNASLAGASLIDVKLLRERGRMDVSLARSKDVDARLSYSFENRDGDRSAGASFGYQNVVEIAEPVHYRTDEFTGSLEWKPRFGLVHGTLAYSRFANDLQSVSFANPFRATDSTELNAEFGPSPFGIDGPAQGRIALPPDNEALRGSVGFLAKLPGRSRFSADWSLGKWTQDSQFIPYSSNTAITTPVQAANVASLPAQSLNGDMHTFAQAYTFSSRPIDGLVFIARYRYYKLGNDTPRITVPGEAYYDGFWNYVARISVPYAYSKDRLFASAEYAWGHVNFETGFTYEGWNREFRETGRTAEGLYHVRADWRPTDWALVRGLVQWGSRDYDVYLPRAGESSSYPNGKPPTLLSELRRFDQAKRDSRRYGGEMQLSPGNATIYVSYLKGTEDYYATQYGLKNADTETLSAQADYSIGERTTLFGYASHEKLGTLQHGAQRGPTGAPNPATEWSSTIADKVDSFGLGATFSAVKDKADLRLQGSYQKVDGNNDLTAAPPRVAVGIPGFDDSRIVNVTAEFSYTPKPHWTATLGGFYEDFTLTDSTRTGLAPYVPGGFFIVGNAGAYTAKVGYLKLAYSW